MRFPRFNLTGTLTRRTRTPKPPPKRRWGVTFCLPSWGLMGKVVAAPTKSEARALLKRESPDGRIPPGTVIEELDW